MKNRSLTSLTLSLIACTTVVSSIGPASFCGADLLPAAKAASSAKSKTGLDAATVRLVNRGQWNDVVDKLKSQADAATTADTSQSWLAFAYMFLDRCDDLKALSDKVHKFAGADTKNDVPATVEVFNLICQKKLDEAEKLSNTLTASGFNDVIMNMALAAVSAKTGNATKAIEYCNKAVEMAPDFAWGYRTIGFIEARTLKDNPAAEDAYQKALAVEPDCKEVRDLLVDLHIGRNDFDGAIDVAEAGIKGNPRDPMNYYRLSQVFTQQWRLREASAELDKAIRLAPDNPRFHRAKASILRWERNLPGAIAEQQKAVDLSTDKSFELTELAALNELAGNDSAAADNLKQAISLAPSGQSTNGAAHQKLVQLLIKGKRWSDLVTEYQRAIQMQPKSGALHLGLADTYLKMDKVDDAMKELDQAAHLDQNDPRPHRMMGAILVQRHEFPAATRAYTRALNINPGSVEDLVALGYTYAADDEYMKAETAFVTALALQQLTQAQGSREDVMRSLATLLLSEGRYTEAALNYEQILRSLQGSPTAAQDALMLAEAKALRDRTATAAQEAIAAFDALTDHEKTIQRAGLVDTLLRLNKPEMAMAQLAKLPDAAKQERQWLILQARALRMKGDAPTAEQIAAKALEAKDDSKELQAAAYTELAQVMLDKGDVAAADAAVRKATDLNNKSFHAYEVMGRIYLKRGDTQHAIEAAKQATEINPYYTPAYMLIGDSYKTANKLNEAVNNYKRAVELYPSYLDAHRSLRDVYKKLAQTDDVQREEQLISQMEKNG